MIQEGRITALVAEALEREVVVHDLEAMRDVLAPREILPRPGLEFECVFHPAADGVAGDLT